jgi:transcriptional regulator with XRE-family HTH domain
MRVPLEGWDAPRLGARIRDARLHSGLTLGVAAKRAGVHPNTLSNLERGKSAPTRDTLERLAEVLGKQIDEIVHTTPASPPAHEAVEAFLEGLRAKTPRVFEGWNDEMWRRYLSLGKHFGIVTEAAAEFFADQVRREYRCIEQFLELSQANQSDAVVALLSREYDRYQSDRNAQDRREERLHAASFDVPHPHGAALKTI